MKLLAVFFCCILLFLLINNDNLHLETEQDDQITVTVEGAVEEEQTLHLDRYATMQEALNEIQISENADTDTLNPNTVLKDGDCIIIPEKKEQKRISINSATAEELITLPGIGPKTAERIIRYREENGLFQSIDDLVRVKGIGEKKLDKIRDLIAL